jgi:hypothetical protein
MWQIKFIFAANVHQINEYETFQGTHLHFFFKFTSFLHFRTLECTFHAKKCWFTELMLFGRYAPTWNELNEVR